jgi:shikimate kinase
MQFADSDAIIQTVQEWICHLQAFFLKEHQDAFRMLEKIC